MRFYIDNRPEIGDTLTLRPLILTLKTNHPTAEITVREDKHELLSDLGVHIADRCCVICGEIKYELVTGTPYSKCASCGFWYQFPVPPPKWEANYVERQGHLMSPIDKGVNAAIAQGLYDMYAPTSVFDVGSKYPYLLHCFRQLGIENVHGIDGCEDSVEYGEQLGVPMTRGNFLQYTTEQKYDMMTMIHLIEHFPDPRAAIQKAKKLLKPDGMLILRTPYVAHDLESSLALRNGDSYRDLNESHYEIHPVLFSEQALMQLLEQEGFEITLSSKLNIGQIDIHAKFVKDKQTNPILHQWTTKHPSGDYLRRATHFYKFPFAMAKKLGWLDEVTHESCALPDFPKIDHLNLPEDYIVIAHESGGLSRQWPIGRWRKLATWLMARGQNVVVVGAGSFPFQLPGLIDLTRKTSVKGMMAVVAGAKLTISADTVIPHIASAVGVPAIALMGPTAQLLTFDYNVEVVRRRDDGCTACHTRVVNEEDQPLPIHMCGCNPSECMDAISLSSVLSAVRTACPAVGSDDMSLLSVCMMVRNESKGLKAALESIKDVADEIVIVDTGSTDDTESVARATVPEEKLLWASYDAGTPIRSFSEARNYAFSLAKSRYVMWFDAGDRLTDAKKLRVEVEKQLTDTISLQTIYGGHYWRVRVVLREFAEFVDRVHEILDVDDLSGRDVAVPIIHVWQEKKGREDSLSRNVRMLKVMLTETPKHPRAPRWLFYMAKDLMKDGKTARAIECYKQRAIQGGFWEERAHSLIVLARHCTEKKMYRDALNYAYDLLKTADGWRDPYYLVGDCYFWMGKYNIALRWYEHALKIPEPNTVLWKWDDLYSWLTYCQISYCHERLGNQKEALIQALLEKEHTPLSGRDRVNKRIQKLSSI